MNPYIPSTMVKIVPLLFFYKEGFGVKNSVKVDMPLNKETEKRKQAKGKIATIISLNSKISICHTIYKSVNVFFF